MILSSLGLTVLNNYVSTLFSFNSSVVPAPQSLSLAAFTQKTVKIGAQCPDFLHGCARSVLDDLAGAWCPTTSTNAML